MSYTDDQWDNVMAFLNDEAEKREPDGVGHRIESAEELVHMLRTTEAIKPEIVGSNAHETREFAELRRARVINEEQGAELQDRIDNHPGNPGRR